jgi:hypothetical protein
MTQGSRSVWTVAIPALTLLMGSSLLVVGQDPEFDDPPVEMVVSSDNCMFLSDPVRFMDDSELRYAVRSNEMNRVVRWSITATEQGNAATVDANSIPRQNLIDEEIFPRMAAANIRSAPIANDAEFLRRATLDLTGRIPSAADVTAFLANPNTNKREATIDALVASPEFADKWTMFFGDLFQNNVANAQVQRQIRGRDAFYLYLRAAIGENRPYDVIARELITATGDSFTVGTANWPVGNRVAGGPIQDTYDGAAVDLAQMFLGINAVDCLLCHDGTKHLDQVNLWGAGQTRQNLWGLAAYFSRVTMVLQQQNGPFLVSDNTTGVYRLNTTSGNRSARAPIGTMNTIAPRNPFANPPSAGIQTGETYRQAIARQITGDIQFARAAVNYVWEKMMVEALVTPSNGFDLARLDANNPPPEPWTLQPTNPKLLDRLARHFQDNGYNLQLLAATIAKSSAYQLSSTYNGTWNSSYVPYYARKYVRRLDGEEIADAVVKATGISQTYTFSATSVLPPVQWAMQLPDTQEPRVGGGVNGVLAFLNAYGRGDRDLNPRRFDGSVLQGLTQMNNAFVNNRIHQNNVGSRVATLLQQTTDPTTIINQLYLNTLSRPATEAEIDEQLPRFQQSGNRAAAENLQWVLLNRLQFLFNY